MTHTVTIKEIEDWATAEAWHLAASSAGNGSRKMLEMSNDGIFRVTDRGKVMFHGSDIECAVEAYNAAP